MRTSAVSTRAAETTLAGRLNGRIVRREALDRPARDVMFHLLAAHFVGADRRVFEADLDEKHCAILLEDGNGVLRGFSTLMLYPATVAGRTIAVVYSGDTIVDRGWWGTPSLPQTWIRAVRALAVEAGGNDLYWLLLTSGYRTYRFLPVFFRSFYPRYDDEGSGEMANLLGVLAAERFGSRYDATRGIVRFSAPQVLAPHLLELPNGRTRDPHIAYFLARNPGHLHGDELACLTMIRDDNLTRAGRRRAQGAEGD